MNLLEKEKARLRRHYEKRRKAAFDRYKEGAGAALLNRGKAAGIARFSSPFSFYWPFRSEIDPRPLAFWLKAQGLTPLLPRLVAEQAPLSFHLYEEKKPLVPGNFGLLEPEENAAVLLPSTLFVPLLAVDKRGFRLGYGGGFYDRTLASLRKSRGNVISIGLAFEEQRVDILPNGPFDQKLDALMTPEGYYLF